MAGQIFGASQLASAQVSISSTEATVVAARNSRHSVVVQNLPTSAQPVFVGPATVTATTGIRLAPGDSVVMPFVGAIEAITASGTATVVYLDFFD